MYVDSSNYNPINLGISGLSGAGTYTDSIYFQAGGTAYMGLVTYTVTAFGPIGSYVQGTFTGPVASMYNVHSRGA
jgi:hypothetical protein